MEYLKYTLIIIITYIEIYTPIYAAQPFIPKNIKILVVTINNDIYSIGQPIKLE